MKDVLSAGSLKLEMLDKKERHIKNKERECKDKELKFKKSMTSLNLRSNEINKILLIIKKSM